MKGITNSLQKASTALSPPTKPAAIAEKKVNENAKTGLAITATLPAK